MTRPKADHAAPSGEDVERRIAELVEAVRARDEFISIAAHELRNPMTPILFLVEKLLNAARRLPESAGGRLVSDAESLERMVDAYIRRATTLLDISRITSGKLYPDLSEVDLSGLIRDVAAELAPTAERAGSPLRLFIADGIAGTLDRLSVERIAENLLSNAIKYGAGKPIDITLAGDGDAAWFRVRDGGIGIAKEAQARIFERFERVVMQGHEGGFGIGLWTIRRLAEAMGGELSVVSRSGEGSTFTVRLPLTQDNGEQG
jgi:signal transduction histidine kinase